MSEENEVSKKMKIVKNKDGKIYEYEIDRYDTKAYSKKYYITHTEQMKEMKKAIYEKRKGEHYNCEICGGHYDWTNKSRHNKSKNHIYCLNLRNELSNKNI